MLIPLTYEVTVRFPVGYSLGGGVIFESYSDDETASFSFEVSEGGKAAIITYYYSLLLLFIGLLHMRAFCDIIKGEHNFFALQRAREEMIRC